MDFIDFAMGKNLLNIIIICCFRRHEAKTGNRLKLNGADLEDVTDLYI